MANLQSFHLAHLPSNLTIHITLFQNLENAAFLRQQLLDGNADYEYALIDASVIVSTKHILAGVFRAANDYLANRLKSRNVHSEIVFALSPNNNIAESFRRFGIADTTTNLLAIKLSTSSTITHDSVKEHLTTMFNGESIEFSDKCLAQKTDLVRVRKLYKLNTSAHNKQNDIKGGASGVKDEFALKELEISVIGLMALRGAG